MPRPPVLTLLSGLPCSGKTTYARSLEAAGAIRISVDEAMIASHGRLGQDYEPSTHLKRLDPVLDDVRQRAMAALTSGADVVLDHGLGRRAERDAWKLVALQTGARWDLIRFDADLATLRARCALRGLSADSVPISDELLRSFAASWEAPEGEGERIIDSTVGWVQDFYSVTDRWWGQAESRVRPVDHARARWLTTQMTASNDASVLELGCGYGTTVTAVAELGFDVTGVDFSDRIDRASTNHATFVRADFMTHDFGTRFDAVTYWDGFGVGTDSDQLALLDRIANEFLKPDGVVLIEVFDPTGFHTDDGLLEHLPASPEHGYPYALDHARTYDLDTHRCVDAWKQHDADRIWSQSLRCYSPDEFGELAATSKLELREILAKGRSAWSFITVLRRNDN